MVYIESNFLKGGKYDFFLNTRKRTLSIPGRGTELKLNQKKGTASIAMKKTEIKLTNQMFGVLNSLCSDGALKSGLSVNALKAMLAKARIHSDTTGNTVHQAITRIRDKIPVESLLITDKKDGATVYLLNPSLVVLMGESVLDDDTISDEDENSEEDEG
jgi:hypothetical protein